MATRRTQKLYSRWAAVACAVALVAFAVSGRGQAPAPAPGAPPAPQVKGRAWAGGDGAGMGGGAGMRIVGFEGNLGNRIVTGSPFSADGAREFKRTLSDGTVIDRKFTGMFARDGQGRTRIEVTPPAIGPFAATGTLPTFISINDPVAHKRYMLNPKDKTAREIGGFDGARMGGHDGMRGGHDGDRDGARGRDGMGGGDGGPMMRGGQATTVSLGSKMVQGVNCVGTRTTSTIPAGAMGNAQPIVISFERWYSPDLLTDVMTVRSNPFEGTTTFTLTNLKRGEPDASLFTVPADYKLLAGPGPNMRTGGPNGPGGQMGPGQHMMHRNPGGSSGNSGGGTGSPMPPMTPAPAPAPQGQGQGQSE